MRIRALALLLTAAACKAPPQPPPANAMRSAPARPATAHAEAVWFEFLAQGEAFFVGNFGTGRRALRIDNTGVHVVSNLDPTPDAHQSPGDAAGMERLRRRDDHAHVVAAFSDAHPHAEAVTISSPIRRGEALAFALDDKVHVTDLDGRALFRPVAVPRLEHYEDKRLTFVTDTLLAYEWDVMSSSSSPGRRFLEHAMLIDLPTGRVVRLREGAGFGTTFTHDAARVALVAENRVRLLDTRSNATLLDIAVEISGPVSSYFSKDERRLLIVNNEGDLFAIDISALAGRGRVPRARFVRTSGYDPNDDLVYTCRDRVLRVESPFSPDRARELPFDPCGTHDHRQLTWTSGYFVVRTGDRISFLRLRDGATLEVDVMMASRNEIALSSVHTSPSGVSETARAFFR